MLRDSALLLSAPQSYSVNLDNDEIVQRSRSGNVKRSPVAD